ncbi:MAG: BMP family ABC transporter substrate-binding protein, partial [Clostridia bacterium]|nr:BMP family ABC transporter substrate-binding protein [Clostridia bacterium]
AYGTELAEACSGINAFALGAMAANPAAQVYVKVLNSWYDPANETAFAEALLQDGCDVITQHCDTPNPQKAAQAAGVWGCGYNSDMTADAPKAHLVSAIWNWEVYYTAAVSAAIEGVQHFMQVMTKNWYHGIEDGFVDVSVSTLNCAPGTRSAINKVKAMLINGDFNVFEGRKLTITVTDGIATIAVSDYAMGDLVKGHSYAPNFTITAGEQYLGEVNVALVDGVIQGTMNQFVENVTLK